MSWGVAHGRCVIGRWLIGGWLFGRWRIGRWRPGNWHHRTPLLTREEITEDIVEELLEWQEDLDEWIREVSGGSVCSYSRAVIRQLGSHSPTFPAVALADPRRGRQGGVA